MSNSTNKTTKSVFKTYSNRSNAKRAAKGLPEGSYILVMVDSATSKACELRENTNGYTQAAVDTQQGLSAALAATTTDALSPRPRQPEGKPKAKTPGTKSSTTTKASKVVPAAAKKAPVAKNAPKPKKEPKPKTSKNKALGALQVEILRESSVERPVKQVWEVADKMKGARRKDVIAACVAKGIAYYTARTQYQLWKALDKTSKSK